MQAERGANIVMYHYVRPLALTRFPEIKARQLADFDRQLDHLTANYEILSMDEFLSAFSQDALPERAATLTFDDGFIDHYTYALPRLMERGITAAFYPAAGPLVDFELLDVHRIHFILAAAPRVGRVATEMEALMLETMTSEQIASVREEWGKPNAFDTGEVIYIKRALQVALPRAVRNDLCARLFKRFVSADERAFAEEIYMNTAQLRLMRELGMHIGSHAYTHEWLSRLSPSEQSSEIQASLDMLTRIGVDVNDGWTMAFPYGDRNADTHALLEATGCKAAFTTEHRVADPKRDEVLDLPRIDTVSLYP
jgi:peptidoglycan/xylan/chitin deacetylase (PgdA/CDA1 family)